jgi:hypothetical protein
MKQVKIMGIDYSVVQVGATEVVEAFKDSPHFASVKELVGENGENFAGLCDAQKCVIYIFKDLPQDKKEKVFVHETIEATDQECLLELPHSRIQEITNLLYMNELLNLSDTKLQTVLTSFEKAGLWTSGNTFTFANNLHVQGKINVKGLLEDDAKASEVEPVSGYNQG